MKKRILILLGILIIGGGAAAGVCWKMGVFGQQETSGDSVYVTKISDLTGQTSGVSNRYAGVVEPQETVSVELESGRTVKEVHAAGISSSLPGSAASTSAFALSTSNATPGREVISPPLTLL